MIKHDVRKILLNKVPDSKIVKSKFPGMPALLNMMSSFPNLETAVSTTFCTSKSWVTSQWTKITLSPNSVTRLLQRESPRSSWTSAIKTLAPCLANSLTVHSPKPLAPPVTMATLPSNLYHNNSINVISNGKYIKKG